MLTGYTPSSSAKAYKESKKCFHLRGKKLEITFLLMPEEPRFHTTNWKPLSDRNSISAFRYMLVIIYYITRGSNFTCLKNKYRWALNGKLRPLNRHNKEIIHGLHNKTNSTNRILLTSQQDTAKAADETINFLEWRWYTASPNLKYVYSTATKARKRNKAPNPLELSEGKFIYHEIKKFVSTMTHHFNSVSWQQKMKFTHQVLCWRK